MSLFISNDIPKNDCSSSCKTQSPKVELYWKTQVIRPKWIIFKVQVYCNGLILSLIAPKLARSIILTSELTKIGPLLDRIHNVIIDNVALYVWQSNVFEICACCSDIRHNECCYTQKIFFFSFLVMCGFLNCLNFSSFP